MGIVLLISVLIPVLVAVVSFVASKVVLWTTFRKIDRLNMGWEKVYKKMLHDGWVPPKSSKWFHDYVDAYHPGCNPNRCWVVIAEEEQDGTT